MSRIALFLIAVMLATTTGRATAGEIFATEDFESYAAGTVLDGHGGAGPLVGDWQPWGYPSDTTHQDYYTVAQPVSGLGGNHTRIGMLDDSTAGHDGSQLHNLWIVPDDGSRTASTGRQIAFASFDVYLGDTTNGGNLFTVGFAHYTATANAAAIQLKFDQVGETENGASGTFRVHTLDNGGNGTEVHLTNQPLNHWVSVVFGVDWTNNTYWLSIDGQLLADGEGFTRINGANAGGYKLQFRNEGTNENIYLDNISVGNVIPEPSTVSLLGFVGASLFAAGRRRH